jgi:hypothetical protein
MGIPRRLLSVTACAVLLMAPADVLAAPEGLKVVVPRFTEEARSAGIEHVNDGSWQYFVGGGLAVLDCDDDGRPDLYFAGGEGPAALYRNQSQAGGILAFERVASAVTDLDAVMGAYPLDIDSDGIADLAVLRNGENVLLRGTGGCGFERANEAWGFDGGGDQTAAFSATWEAGQTWPTLAFGNYIDHVDDQGITTCAANYLFRPATDGSGYAAPVTLEPGYCALSMLFSDWDRSGQRDLRVSNDRHYYYDAGEEQLWRMAPDEAPTLYTRDDGWRRVQIYGMGIAGQDLDGDGYPEYYLTSIGSNRLETLASGPSRPDFEDQAYQHGISATTPWLGKPIYPSTSWHPEFDDVNNDGWIDLYVSKGNVDSIPDNAAIDPNELFLGRADGTFVRAARQARITNKMNTRGAALADLNADGLLDLVEVNRYKNVSLRRNVGRGTAAKARPMGHWLEVELQQPGSNLDAIGAWVEVRWGKHHLVREVTVGGGHGGGQLGPLHFGLGQTQKAEVRVTWPDGTQGDWLPVKADGLVTISREGPGEGQPTPGA